MRLYSAAKPITKPRGRHLRIDDHVAIFRIQRCIDGFFAWMLFEFVLLVSRQAFCADGSLSFAAIIPIFGMAWSAVSFPELPHSSEWSLVRVRLRVFALIWAGCSPSRSPYQKDYPNSGWLPASPRPEKPKLNCPSSNRWLRLAPSNSSA